MNNVESYKSINRRQSEFKLETIKGEVLNINNSIHDYEELEKSLDEINDEINEREETFVTTMIKNTRKDEFKKYILEKRHSDEELSNAVEKILAQDSRRVCYTYEHSQTKEFDLNILPDARRMQTLSLNRASTNSNQSKRRNSNLRCKTYSKGPNEYKQLKDQLKD